MRETPYFEQADLLLQILPAISKIESFALKGGTAINLFLRDLPRLSVDIDLTYLPLDDRSTTLENIDSYLTHIAKKCQDMFRDDLEVTFKETFEGMAFEPVPLGKMVEVWKEVVKKLNHDFTENERAFMLSFKRKSPQWDLFPVKGIQHLPAVKWKMVNLKKMDAQKHKITLRKLEDVLGN
ncbi:MAG: hypothetical protein EA359_03200 [Balneolaceae bacterium]|nr:MAG: hypothetical protein EA359_03200 [Balneolaceae bacterium]